MGFCVCNPVTDQFCDLQAVHQTLLANQCLPLPRQVEAGPLMVLALARHDPSRI